MIGPSAAQAANQMFTAKWYTHSFGNECWEGDPSPGPNCAGHVTGEWESYSAWGMPQGIQCNPAQPRCPSVSTPTNGIGGWVPLGGSQTMALYCAPWNDSKWGSKTMRPAKGATARDTNGQPIPPLYRNPAFFTPGGEPNRYSCAGYSSSSSSTLYSSPPPETKVPTIREQGHPG
jgi:hypothetical protein